ncbi:MAG: Proline-tRNA ligase [Candidatus Roizmanbacteria bacterium GW2011_GWA2_34_18]|uniref:Proline--tRNA ligase n=1 Tax=Candidatus Roizmanbacteria bacterium GW2011_GWA2_34_18 TaxID=1618477 RepID=A0A0G0BD03_9BACT|nr:MAG: Proline-tRNA ligase [Candidatus Roizmanbacteria bacterium GW2011_GWA2_34_18]
MLYSKLFGKTVREAAKEAQVASYKLLHQAGFIRESTAGRYFFLPLGQIVQQKIMKVIKEEMDRAGAQEMISPVLHPLELWQETNRTKTTGFELMTIKDRRGADFALGGTAEEMFVDVVRKFQISYKDLPFNIYQFSTKFRDELRARGGLLRVREFIMKDAYSFDRNEKEFKKEYENMWNAYKKIFDRLGLKTVVVESDNGYIGGDYCHEFVVESEVGESKFFITEDGNYAAHEEIAKFYKENKNLNEEILPLKEVEAKRGTTMEDGVKLHNKPLWQQIKDVLYVDENNRFILAIIRGDFDVNEIKLKHLSGANSLRHATDDEIINKIHSEPGFISPVGIQKIIEKNIKLIIVADDSLRTIKNAYGGANKKYQDLFNMNIDRDYESDIEGDIALAKAGYLTIDKKQRLIEKQGIEVGNIFQLGYYYSKKMKGANFINQDGKEKPFYMGCYGIGIGRTIATIVEKYHDDKGIIWPETVAPFKVHLLGLDLKDEQTRYKCYNCYNRLLKAGIEVLFDDREEVTAGEKFADADLIGVPIRLVVSKRTGEKIEYKKRNEKKFELISVEDVLKKVRS